MVHPVQWFMQFSSEAAGTNVAITCACASLSAVGRGRWGIRDYTRVNCACEHARARTKDVRSGRAKGDG